MYERSTCRKLKCKGFKCQDPDRQHVCSKIRGCLVQRGSIVLINILFGRLKCYYGNRLQP